MSVPQKFRSKSLTRQYEYHDFAGNFPRTKRNFVRENMHHIKHMQGLASSQAAGEGKAKPDKYRNVPSRVFSHLANSKRGSQIKMGIRRPASFDTRMGAQQLRGPKTVHRGVQTERTEDVPKFFETAVMKVPGQSPSKSPQREDQGDTLSKNMQKLAIADKHDYVKENIKCIRQRIKADSVQSDPNKPPPTYQKGTVPKYLNKQKEDNPKIAQKEEHAKYMQMEGDDSGLTLLPDEERKEYLRVARENYAVLIRELNSMPVRNDTLKKRNRKIEIEEELKRLDEVIKIFQKPKVFVKADA